MKNLKNVMKIPIPPFFLFSIIIALSVGVLTIINVPCPVCEGTGVLTGAKGLEVEKYKCELIGYNYVQISCGDDWHTFAYSVNILLTNPQRTESRGYVMVVFYELGSEAEDESTPIPIVEIPIYVKIPAETTKNIERVVEFGGSKGGVYYGFYGEFYGQAHELHIEIPPEAICQNCLGTKKVPFTEFLKAIVR